MKLFGWMHRKLRQNNDGGDRGSACMFCVSGWESPDDGHPNLLPSALRRELLPPAGKVPQESTAAIHFDGLLNIGTFGLPVMTVNVEEMAEMETEMEMDKEAISISNELEKVLADETEKELASVRLSHADAGGKGSEILPLQHFLLGSPVEVADTIAREERREDRRRERRVSLGEMFMKSRASEEGGGGGKKDDSLLEDNGVEKIGAVEEMNMEFMGRKRMPNVLGSIGDVGGGGGGCGGAAGICRGKEKKAQNILKMFHRKIHPESSAASKKSKKPSKCDKRGKNGAIKRGSRRCADGYHKEVLPPEKAEGADQSISTVKSHCCYPGSGALLRNSSMDNREHWIKTDAEYLVLEL